MHDLSVTSANPAGVAVSTPIATAATTFAPVSRGSGRDSWVTNLGAISSDVNLLRQAATAAAASPVSVEGMLTLPPAPPMPAPAKPATVPTDDHGQSNIVFSDSDADGAFIS